MTSVRSVFAAIAMSFAAAQALAVDITFDNLPVNTVLSNQYAGVVFSANAFTGTGGPTGTWATNTNMSIVSAGGTDAGGLGTPLLVSGNLLHSLSGWEGENGDPSFRISFAAAINSISADFAGVSTPSSVRLFAYNGATLLGTVTGTQTGQFTLAFTAPLITSVVVTPGDFEDWVGVDNIRYIPAQVAAVPEPSSTALMALGLACVGVVGARRKRG